MNNRFRYVDIARAIGIILVMIGHIELLYVPFCGSVHIPLFFILSGFVYDIDERRSASYKECVIKRVKRLIIPYFIYNMLLFVKYAAKLVLTHTATGTGLLKAFFGFIYSAAYITKDLESPYNMEGFVFGNGPLWFLTSMAVASLIFYGIIFFVLKREFNLKKVLVSIVALLVISWSLCKLPIYLPWSIEMAFLGAAFMLAGMAARRYNVVEKMYGKFYIPVICVILFTALHWFNGWANLALLEYGKSIIVYYILGLLGSIVIGFISLYLEKAGLLARGLSYIGQNTLVILALHMTVISLMVSGVSVIGAQWIMNIPVVYVIIRFVVGLCGCIGINEFMLRVLKIPKKYI